MDALQTVKVHIHGIVQGVGFRPFIAKLARRMDMRGQVRNIGGLVEILLTDSADRIQSFLSAVEREKPFPAEIVHIQVETIARRHFDAFTIDDSSEGGGETVMIPVDLAVCPACLEEMADKGDRRYRHPFISCMACGPRYSIIEKVPYDRQNTTMESFAMCDDCAAEYRHEGNRRYHAQTVSCHRCGPQLYQMETDLQGEAALEEAITLLQRGEIIAIKGVGGYNFVASPFRDDTVRHLRQLKGREEKPFAVMFHNVQQIAEYCYLSEEERRLLESTARPIVLLETRAMRFAAETSKTSRYTGCFLPSMGLHYLLLQTCGPLIVTSANLSDTVMMTTEAEMSAFLRDHRDLLKGVFYHDREILNRLDDSVVRVIDGQPQMIRRAKGYVPLTLQIGNMETLDDRDAILAFGPHLKSTFALTKGSTVYNSQFFGDLDSVETIQFYEQTLEGMQTLLRIEPTLLATDSHPLYYTHRLAADYAKRRNLPLLEVQHHHAHIAAVMAEHDLVGPVLGVAFDGTGYGDDGTIWGGEFLLCEGRHRERIAHLEAVPMLGGDDSMKEGWKAAMSYMVHAGGDVETGPLAKDPRYPVVKAALRQGVNRIDSSSMGRLFDAVSSYAGIHEENRYEGECAIQLENRAALALAEQVKPLPMEYAIEDSPRGWTVSATPIFLALATSKSPTAAALGFHEATARMIAAICERARETRGVEQISLGGGVFQNKILIERTLELLRQRGFQVYYTISVSPNDGGVALGQAYLAMEYLKEQKHVHRHPRKDT